MCASVFFGRRLGLQLLHRKPTVAKVAPVAHFSLRFFSLSKLNAKMVLAGKEDNFGGVTIIADEAWKDANDTPGFKKALEVSADVQAVSTGNQRRLLEILTAPPQESLEEWKKAGKRGLWIKFPTSHGNLVGAATSNGFDFHHAQVRRLFFRTTHAITRNKPPSRNDSHTAVDVYLHFVLRSRDTQWSRDGCPRPSPCYRATRHTIWVRTYFR
jgi:hypothetical protein